MTAVADLSSRGRTHSPLIGAARRLGRAWERIRRPADAILGVRVVVWLSAAALLLKLLPPRAVLRMIGGRRSVAEVRWQEVERVRAMVDAWIGVWPFRGRRSCLRRSLVLYRLLRAQGLDVGLELGVRRAAGRLAGHSWIIWRGAPLFEPLDPFQDFATMDYWSHHEQELPGATRNSK